MDKLIQVTSLTNRRLQGGAILNDLLPSRRFPKKTTQTLELLLKPAYEREMLPQDPNTNIGLNIPDLILK
jgi:hypothetical protein